MSKYKNFFCKQCQIKLHAKESQVSCATYSAASFPASMNESSFQSSNSLSICTYVTIDENICCAILFPYRSTVYLALWKEGINYTE
jgi:hypothetical protein